MIRAPLSYRFWFLMAVITLVVLTVVVMDREKDQPWKAYQLDYARRYADFIGQKIQAAVDSGNSHKLGKWQALLKNADEYRVPSLKSIFLPDAGIRDFCQTCHLALENPMFEKSTNPLKHHPGNLFTDHPPARFGCTLCHQGQGMGLTVEKAHGFEENWPLPRVPGKYVQGLCYGCHPSAYQLKGAESAEKGRRLFAHHGCFGCHRVRNMEYLTSLSTPLDGISDKIGNFNWVYRWLKNPADLRKDTLMPTFKLKPENISDITACLAAWKKEGFRLENYEKESGSIQSGETLFTEKGCIACHSAESETPGISAKVPNLGDAGLKLRPQWTLAWLKNPAQWDPTTPMPKLTLTDAECRDLAEYVMSRKAEGVSEALSAEKLSDWERGNQNEGKRLIQTYGCYGCHPIKEMNELPPVGDDVANMADKRLDELPFGDSAVEKTKWDWLFHKIKKPDIYEQENMPLKMPDHTKLKGFTDNEIIALTTFYLHNKYYDLPGKYLGRIRPERINSEKSEWLLDHLHCKGCHQFSEDQKARVENSLSLKSLVPPRLVDEGQRAQPQWMFQFLSRPVELRPWLKMRMPNFNWTYQEKVDLINYFAARGNAGKPDEKDETAVPYVRLPVKADYDPEIIAMGEYRVTTDKCVQCHPVSLDQELPKDIKLEDLSINLMLAKSRLRFDWIKKFLRNPDIYAGKGTKMPFVYYTPDGVPRISDPETWIEYSALYLMFMEKMPEIPKEKPIEDVRPGSDVDWTSY
jgi:mono/diheme cytochrome c family protein